MPPFLRFTTPRREPENELALTIWNALKMIVIGPVSLVFLMRPRLRETNERRTPRSSAPSSAGDDRYLIDASVRAS